MLRPLSLLLLVMISFSLWGREPDDPQLVLYPDRAELTAVGVLDALSPGRHSIELPLPAEVRLTLAELGAVQLPDGVELRALTASRQQQRHWPQLLKDQVLTLPQGGELQVVDVFDDALIVKRDGQLRLLTPPYWNDLILPEQIRALLRHSEQPGQPIQMSYQVLKTPRENAYYLRYSYRGLSWQVRHRLQGRQLVCALYLGNTGKLALDAPGFELVQGSQVQPLPRMMAAEMADGMQRSAVSELGQRRYRFEQPLRLPPESEHLQRIAGYELAQPRVRLEVRDWLFNRIAERQSAQRWLRLVMPDDLVALPAGQLKVLSEDGLAILGQAQLPPLEPGQVQDVMLGSSALISASKQFIHQDRQSARFRLTLTNHSDQAQRVEYWLQGVRQVGERSVAPSEGYRLVFDLPARGKVDKTLLGWAAE